VRLHTLPEVGQGHEGLIPSWPQFNPKTPKRVAGILRTGRVNYWTGPEGVKFETAFAAYIGTPNAVSVSSGTAALHLALEALGIGAGDDVVVTPYSFRASATCVANARARPVFADVGPDHMLNAATIEKVLTPRTKAVVVVHLYGQVADMGPILRLAKARRLFVIEDCAQCLGGEYRGRKVGTIGDVGCFSFCQSKHITTGGEGGMVVSRRKRVTDAVRSLRDHGWILGSKPKDYDRIGYNARLTEIQSVIGRGELERFESWNLPRRRRLAEALVNGLKRFTPEELGGVAPTELIRRWPVDTPLRRASFWLVPFVLDASRLKCSVAKFIESLQDEGALCYRILWPLITHRPGAADLIGDTVGFWVHPTYSLKDISRDLDAFRKVASRLTIKR